MRVIAGSARGRRLTAGRGRTVRPTADKVKGALFSSLASRFTIESAAILDLFAGSGALGIEALSRGAAHVTFVEHAAAALPALRDWLRDTPLMQSIWSGLARPEGEFAVWAERLLQELLTSGVLGRRGDIVYDV